MESNYSLIKQISAGLVIRLIDLLTIRTASPRLNRGSMKQLVYNRLFDGDEIVIV
jgi:hypothetical protein